MSTLEPTSERTAPSRTRSFVGRAHELAVLRASLEDAVRGQGRLVLLAGEPGIGKTRTAEEICGEASVRGLQVLWGRCHEGAGAPAYWPWAQAIRASAQASGEAVLRVRIGVGAADLAHIVPELVAPALEVRSPPPPLDPTEARFRVFQSVATFLGNAASSTPLLLVLDDLHWADAPSLLVLRFLAQEMTASPLLVIGTYRDVEVGREHPLFDALGELTRASVTRRLALRGFDAGDLARYVEDASGVIPSAAALDAVLRETGGNPFFVGEVLRPLIADGGLARLAYGPIGSLPPPETVREVIARRVGKLSPDCGAMLETASVIGREFVVNHLERLADLPRDRLLAALDEASTARIVVATPETLAGYRFTHALVRETLYEELPTFRRAMLHRRVGEVLEALHGESSKPHLATLAHHFFEAARAGGEVAKAIAAARRAGDHADEMLAFEEAAWHYERALAAIDLEPDRTDDRQTLALLRALGAALLKSDGPSAPKTATLERAVVLAERIGDPELQAATALEYHDAVNQGPLLETGLQVPVLQRALDALGPSDSALGARLLAAIVLSHPRATARRRSSEARAARAMADRVGDVDARQAALVALHTTLLGPAGTEERLEISAEMLRLLEQPGGAHFATVSAARQARLLDLLEIGDMAGADREIEHLCGLLDRTRWSSLQYFKLLWRGMRASHQGRFAEAERLVLELFASLERGGHLRFSGSAGTQIFALRRAQGRLAEIDAAVLAMAGSTIAVERGAPDAMLGLLHLEMGREDEARAAFERLAADDFGQIEMGWTYLSTISIATTLAHRFRDQARAAVLYERLRPYAARNIVIAHCILVSGSVSTTLGILATTLERFDDAERHFQDAIAFERRTGGRPSLARAQYAYAEMLVARGRPEDMRTLNAVLDAASSTFAQLEMPTAIEEARALRARVCRSGADDAMPARPTPGPSSIGACIFRRDGDFWTIAYEGAECRLRDARGLWYLAILLERPGSEVHAAELVSAVLGAPGNASKPHDGDLPDAPRRSLGDVGPKIDARAARSYQQRLADLRDEIGEAEANNDRGQLGSLRQELEALTDHLVGSGGRGRQGSHGERARQAVTKAIGAALAKIDRNLPALAQHLDATVKRGYFCTYTPDPRHPISWRTR